LILFLIKNQTKRRIFLSKATYRLGQVQTKIKAYTSALAEFKAEEKYLKEQIKAEEKAAKEKAKKK
jgi:hypothetical protein